MIFSIFFCTLRFQILNIVQAIHRWKAYLFRFQMMHKSQFPKIEPYDWFCAPRSHLKKSNILNSAKYDWKKIKFQTEKWTCLLYSELVLCVVHPRPDSGPAVHGEPSRSGHDCWSPSRGADGLHTPAPRGVSASASHVCCGEPCVLPSTYCMIHCRCRPVRA